MRWTACRLACKEHLSCFTPTNQLWCNNFSCSFTTVAFPSNASSIRNYSRQSFSIDSECSYQPSEKDSSLSQPGETSILKASSLQHWFKNWQEERKHKLTASTFAAAIGFFPKRRVQLWLEKLGAIEPFSGNLATCWSNIKEEEALVSYKLITGNTVMFPKFQVYREDDSKDNWLAASPDGEVGKVYGLPGGGVLEIKCPFFDGNMNRAAPWRRIPLFYIPQAQGLMEILDKDWMDFYVWTPNGSSLFRLSRDEEYWFALKMALSDFWWKHVQPAKEICSTSVITNPLTQLQQFEPAPRHELCRYLVIDSKRIVDSSELVFREIHGEWQN